MAVTAKYEKPLQVVETSEMRARIMAIADREEISQAQVCRDLFAMSIDERERQSVEK
jgi:hypothetical protein